MTIVALTLLEQTLKLEHHTNNRQQGKPPMATFSEIVAESEKDRHKVYFLQDEHGNKYRAPKPAKVNKVAALKKLREAERKARAAKMAELYQGDETPLDSLLPDPEHITRADGSLPLMISLLRRVVSE